MKLYEKFGVAEYWIVTTYPPLIEIYALDDSGRFRLYSGGTLGDTIESPAFSGLEIKLDEVFDIPYTEDEMRIFRVKEPPAKYESNGARNRG